MWRLVKLGSLFVAVCAISGCGASADSLMKDQIQLLNQLAEAYETKAPEAKINEIKQKQEENNKKFGDLKLSPDDAKKLAEKYDGELKTAIMRYMKAVVAVAAAKGDFGMAFQGLPGMSNFPMPAFQGPAGGQDIAGGQGNAGPAGTQRIGLPGGRRR